MHVGDCTATNLSLGDQQPRRSPFRVPTYSESRLSDMDPDASAKAPNLFCYFQVTACCPCNKSSILGKGFGSSNVDGLQHWAIWLFRILHIAVGFLDVYLSLPYGNRLKLICSNKLKKAISFLVRFLQTPSTAGIWLTALPLPVPYADTPCLPS